MEMSNKYTNERLQKVIQAESMNFDQDALWSAIDDQLGERRKPLIWLWLIPGLLLVAAASWMWTGQSNSNEAVEQEATVLVSDEKSNEKASASNVSSNDKKDELNKSLIENGESLVKPTESEIKKNTIEKSSMASNKKAKPNQNISSRKSSSSTVINNTSEDSRIPTTPLNLNNNSANSINSEFAQPQTPISSSISDTKNTSTTPELKYSNTLNSDFIEENSLDFLMAKPSLVAYQGDEAELPVANFKRDWSLCEIREPWSFLIEAYGGFSYQLVSNNTTLINGEPNTDYLNLWEDAQSPVGGYQGGLQFVAQSPGGFEIAAGAEFQRLAEKVESERTIIERIRIYDPMAYFTIDENGNRIFMGDTVTQTRITTETRTTELRHTLLNIPIRLGYMLKTDNWNMGAHLGVVLHLDYGFEGIAIMPNGSYMELNNDNQELVYQSSLGLSYSADIHLGRNISDHVELFIRPEFRYHHEPWTSDNHLLSTKIQLVQAQGGLRYRF